MPTVEGLRFAYALHELPAGRWGFRRWRWEVWHGPSLLAAGWRATRRQAERAVVGYASSHAHRLFGLRAPATLRDGAFRPGCAVELKIGAVRLVLVPRPVAEEQRRAALSRPAA